jgi:hypothetical protein
LSLLIQKSSFVRAAALTKSVVGKDLLGYCTKCKMNLMHVIITSGASGKPEKSRCNTCKTDRIFKEPKNDPALSQTEKGKTSMANDMDEYDIEQMDVSGVFAAEPVAKKKAKPRVKKEKSDTDSKSSTKGGPAVPLSMQKGTPEDMAQFEARMLGQKNAVANAKPYKITEKFVVGEALNHKSFGTGFVVAESGLTKIEVLFKEGRKLLVHTAKV